MVGFDNEMALIDSLKLKAHTLTFPFNNFSTRLSTATLDGAQAKTW